MLSEYFSLDISPSGDVQSLPLLLRDYIPNLDNLPSFLMRLGPQVDWTSEKECFETILREIAYFYTPLTFHEDPSQARPSSPRALSEERIDVEDDSVGNRDGKEQENAERWQIQHVVFPAMRKYLVAPKSLLDQDVMQIASLPDLYKVFERC